MVRHKRVHLSLVPLEEFAIIKITIREIRHVEFLKGRGFEFLAA